MKQHFKFVMFIIFLSACEKKAEPAVIERDFTDKILNLTIKERAFKFVELPELYSNTVTQIPAINNEHIILVERLEERGFKTVVLNQVNQQLSGRRIVAVSMVKDDCECEIQKLYYFTSNISEFIVSERIRCIKTGRQY